MPRTSLAVARNILNNRDYLEETIDTESELYRFTEPVIISSIAETRVTVNTPNFKKGRRRTVVDRPELPVNPFRYSKHQYVNPYGTMFWYHPILNRKGRQLGPQLLGTTLNSTLITPQVRERIDNEALFRIREVAKEQTVELGVLFKERKQVADLFQDTTVRIAGALRAVRERNWTAVAANLGVSTRNVESAVRPRGKRGRQEVYPTSKEWADNYLALEFGWKPFYGDLYKSLETLAKSRDRIYRTRIVGSASYRNQVSVTGGDHYWEGIPFRRFENAIYARKYVIYVSVSHEGVKSLAELGVLNPAQIWWQTRPLSFVLDWFIPVGRFLDSLDAFAGLSFEKGSNTSFERVTVGNRCSGIIAEHGGYRRLNASASATHVEVERVPMASFPGLPEITLDPRFSVGKSISSLALIRQRLRL